MTVASQGRRTLSELWRTAPTVGSAFDPAVIAHLPLPARRYLLHALAPGARTAESARLVMAGTIRLDAAWCAFKAEQVLRWDRGFVWTARAVVRGLPVTGFDRFIGGAGAMRWRLLGVIPVMTAGGADVSRSAAGRLHAEAIWCPAVFRRPDIAWTEQASGQPVAVVDAHGERTTVAFDLDNAGGVRACRLKRWGNPTADGYSYHPFGAIVEAERTFGGVTIPTRLRAGWWIGTPRFEEHGEFFRCQIASAEFK